jgi:hypothetical protein
MPVPDAVVKGGGPAVELGSSSRVEVKSVRIQIRGKLAQEAGRQAYVRVECTVSSLAQLLRAAV